MIMRLYTTIHFGETVVETHNYASLHTPFMTIFRSSAFRPHAFHR